LLTDEKTQSGLNQTKQIYQDRARKFSDALATRGITMPGGDGLCCFVPVTSEPYAMVTLAARHIAVAPGAKFSINPTSSVRIATSILDMSKAEEVADAVCVAADPH
jgi:aspartate/methionine/tyrosine aminotransferase